MWDIRDEEINKFPDSKHEVTEDDDEGELEGEDVPVDWGQPPLIVPEARVVAGGLEGELKIVNIISLRTFLLPSPDQSSSQQEPWRE